MLTSTIWYIPKENVVTAPKLETRECRQFLLYTEIVDINDCRITKFHLKGDKLQETLELKL